MIIRYTQIPPVPDWRLRTLMKFEVEEVSSQSGGDVSADYRKLELPDPDGERSDDTVLVALARNRHLERQMKSLADGRHQVRPQGTPNSVALFNAFAVNATYHEDETALLVNIGGDNVDIAVQQRRRADLRPQRDARRHGVHRRHQAGVRHDRRQGRQDEAGQGRRDAQGPGEVPRPDLREGRQRHHRERPVSSPR